MTCKTCEDGRLPVPNGLCPVVGCEFSLPVPYSLNAPPFDSGELSE